MADDFSQLSDEELDRMIAAEEAGPDVSSLSDAELDAQIAKLEGNKDYSLVSAGKQFGSGAVEGTADLISLISDYGTIPGLAKQAYNYFADDDLMTAQGEVDKYVRPLLAEKDPNYRYTRKVGEFVGPDLLTLGIAKAAKAPKLASWAAANIAPSVFGGLGAQGAEDIAPDSPTAQILGGLTGASVPGIVKGAGSGIWKAGKSLLFGQSDDAIKAKVANILREKTRLTPEGIREAMAKMPDDELARLATTAEITDDVGIARIERGLGGSDAGSAADYVARSNARKALRDQMIDKMSEAGPQNISGLADDVTTRAKDVLEQMRIEEGNLWEALSPDIKVNPKGATKAVRGIMAKKRGGLPLDRRTELLADQLENATDSGTIKDIRSSALELMREGNVSAFDNKVLNEIQSNSLKLLEKAFDTDERLFDVAREATTQKASVFSPQTVGGKLTQRNTNVSNALDKILKGDKQSILEFKAAVRNDPQLVERVKSGILDMAGRTDTGDLTPHKMARFLNKNEEGLRELLGDEHLKNLKRIGEDLISEAKVEKLSTRAAKGGSATELRQGVKEEITGAIRGAATMKLGGLPAIALDIVRRRGIDADMAKIESALFQAALDPKVAADILEASPESMRRILPSVIDALEQPARGALLGAATDDESGRSKLAPQKTVIPSEVLPSTGTQRNTGLLGLTEEIDQSSELPPAAQPTPRDPSNQDQTSAVFDAFSAAIEKAESGGKADAVSNKGAVGRMQMMPIAVREVMRSRGEDDSAFTDKDLSQLMLDPDLNKEYGNAYISMLLNDYGGDMELALAAYNAGPSRVDKLLESTGGSTYEDIAFKLPAETRKYVPKVSDYFDALIGENA